MQNTLILYNLSNFGLPVKLIEWFLVLDVIPQDWHEQIRIVDFYIKNRMACTEAEG